MVAAAGGDQIKCARYGTFGSQELSEYIIEALGQHTRACLMANHGMICFGKSLGSAVRLAEEVEVLAKQYMQASILGPPVLLSQAEMEIILAKFKSYGVAPMSLEHMDEFTRKHAIVPPPHRPGQPPC
eukprot:TRINITY_DN24085_c0_g1_i1.p2 TRINITY_DN24085_c0_g1~~TRINITY_DN24085_c0_g1_i1.p2  ORF type:complete len:128 (+),score=31.33 TRINITY_DN24085_c0_g1_i1:215-598(+)